MVTILNLVKQSITGADRQQAEGQYFVGHQFTRQKIDDLRRVVGGAFGPLGLQPYYADRELKQEHILTKILSKILLTRFGVFDLSGLNANVLLELGVAVALGRPCLVIVDAATQLPTWLQPYVSSVYDSLSALAGQLAEIANDYASAPEASVLSQPLEMRGVEQILDQATHPPQGQVLVLDEGLPGAGDLRHALHGALEDFGVEPDSLDNLPPSGIALRAIMDRVSKAGVCVAHLATPPPVLVYFALGLAFGFDRTCFLIARQGALIPSNLAGLDRLEYESYGQLENEFADRTRYLFLDQRVRSAAAREGPQREGDRQRSEALLQEARFVRESGDTERATELFNQLLELDPYNPSVYVGLHHLYERDGDQQASRNLLEMAIMHLPQEGFFYAELFQLLDSMGRTEDARRILQVGLNACPGDETMLSLLPARVVVHARKGEPGRVIELGDRSEYRIGRIPACEIQVDDWGVSKIHARILKQENTYLVQDLHSTNGTILNQRRLAPATMQILRHGDTILVGQRTLLFQRGLADP